MSIIKKTALALSVSALAASGALQAGVLATSVMEMSNFYILGGDGEVLVYDGTANDDFAFLTYTSSADVSASLAPGSDGPYDGYAAGTDLYACVGDCTVAADNTFPELSGAPSTSYSIADQYETGSPIEYSGLTTGATVTSAAYVGIDDSQATVGSAESNNNLQASWVFALNDDQALTFEFDISAYLEAYVDWDEQFPGFATAAYYFEFTITDLGTAGSPDSTEIWALDPNELNTTLSRNAPPLFNNQVWEGGATVGTPYTASYSETTPTLLGGHEYQLSARITTLADARRVPEPGVLALLGIGLLSMFGASHLRRRKIHTV